MNGPVQSQIKAKSTSSAASSVAPAGLLQRNCACGGVPGVDGECSACRGRRLQRHLPTKLSQLAYYPSCTRCWRHRASPSPLACRLVTDNALATTSVRYTLHTNSQAAESAGRQHARLHRGSACRLWPGAVSTRKRGRSPAAVARAGPRHPTTFCRARSAAELGYRPARQPVRARGTTGCPAGDAGRSS